MEAVSKYQKFAMERMLRSTIREHPNNPRIIFDSAKKKLKEKMQEVGLMQPIIVNKRSGYLLGGHQRLATLDALEKYKPGKNDYALDVAVVDLDPKTEAEMLVFLNNPGAMGKWDLEGLADMALSDLGVDFKDMGFDRVDVELMFDGDARFANLFQDDAAAKERKEALRQIKGDGDESEREKKSGLTEFRESGGRDDSSDFYVVVVCKDQAEKEALLKHLRIPKGEQYISPSEILALKRP